MTKKKSDMAKFTTKKKLIFSAMVATLLMVFTVTVYAPSLIYFPQRDMFSEYFIGLIQQPLMFGLLLAAVTLLLLTILPRLLVKYLVALLLVFAVLLWLQADYFAVSYGILDGAELDFEHFDDRGLIELLVVAVAFLVAILVAEKVIQHGVLVAGMILLGQISIVGYQVYQEPDDKKTTQEIDSEFLNYSSEKNIILIVLDTFGAEYFQQLLQIKPELRDQYSGFVSYTNTISNYPATMGSMNSLLTAQMLPEDIKLKAFRSTVLAKQGLPRQFHNKDYKVSVASNSQWLINTYPERFIYEVKISDSTIKNYHSAQLFDYALFRLSMHHFKPKIYNQGKWFISNNLAKKATIPNTPSEKGRMLLNMMTIEAKVKDQQPRFKMIHVTLPHPVYVYDKNCDIEPAINSWPVERRMLEQSECALSQLNIYLDKLKEIGVYDNSLIVVTSDHGSRVFNDHSMTGYPSQFELNSSGVMMIIKGIGQRGAFREVNQPNSLITLTPALLNDSLHETDFSQMTDNERYFEAYQNWHALAPGYLPDAPVYKVGPNYKQADNWQLVDYRIHKCKGQSIPWKMTFENAKRAGYCAVFGLDRPEARGGGTWTASEDIRVLFNLKQKSLQSKQQHKLTMKFEPYLFQGQASLDLAVKINGTLIGETSINKLGTQQLQWNFPNTLLQKEKNVLQIILPNVNSKLALNAGFNHKKLGIFLQSITVDNTTD